MDRLIYTALSGMQASMNRQRVIASNMANAQTIGFRAEQFDQRPVTVTGDGLEARAMQEAGALGRHVGRRMDRDRPRARRSPSTARR
jgi:flagellar basal-body rod protein FlgF